MLTMRMLLQIQSLIGKRVCLKFRKKFGVFHFCFEKRAISVCRRITITFYSNSGRSNAESNNRSNSESNNGSNTQSDASGDSSSSRRSNNQSNNRFNSESNSRRTNSPTDNRSDANSRHHSNSQVLWVLSFGAYIRSKL